LGKFTDFKPRFVRRYANLADTCQQAVEEYAKEVRDGGFPSGEESFALEAAEEDRLNQLLSSIRAGLIYEA